MIETFRPAVPAAMIDEHPAGKVAPIQKL